MQLQIQPERNLRAAQFATLALGMSRRAAGVDFADAVRHAGGSRELVEIARSAIPGTSTFTDAALVHYEPIKQGFLAALAPASAFDAMFPDMQPGPMNQRFGVIVSSATAAQVDEGQAAPATRMSASNGTLQQRRVAALVALSKDIARSAAAVGLMQRSLLQATGIATNAIFVPALAAAAVVSASAGDVGSDTVVLDIGQAVRLMGLDSSSRLHVILGTANAKRVAFMRGIVGSGQRAFPNFGLAGGVLCGLPAHVVDDLVDDVLVVDATALAAAAGDVQLDASTSANLKLATSPVAMSAGAGSPLAPLEASTISLFQTDMVGVLVERVIAFEPLRPGVVRISGTNWGKSGSPLS